jgi:hypothetical protein
MSYSEILCVLHRFYIQLCVILFDASTLAVTPVTAVKSFKFVLNACAVFSAVRSSMLPVAQQKVQYDSILVDTVGGFDTGRTTYTANSSGFYLFHFSAGAT